MFEPKRSGSSAEFEIALDIGAKGGQGRDEMGVAPLSQRRSEEVHSLY
jgi:hypothetical protein